jgi:hypothetical protein
VVADRFDHHVLRAFHREGGGRRRALRADRLTIRGLEGAVGTNDPAAGTVTDGGRAVTLRGDRTLEDFYAVFGDELDPVAGATSQPAIGSLVWPEAVTNLSLLLLFPAIVVGLGLVGLYAAGRQWDADPDRTGRYGAAAVAVWGLVALAAFVGPVPHDSSGTLAAGLLAFAWLAAFGYAVAV